MSPLRGRKRRQPSDRCIAGRTRARRDMRPWHERQPRVLWQLVFDSGYVTQADALSCMQVCRLWHSCVHRAKGMWRRVNLFCTRVQAGSRARTKWSAAMLNAITAKGPKEIAFHGWRADARAHCASRYQVSAVLRRNPQLERLELIAYPAAAVRALSSIQSPLASLTLTWCLDLDSLSFAQIVTGAPMLKQLRQLRVWSDKVTDVTAQWLANEFTQLNVLQLYASTITCAGVGHLSAEESHTRTTLRVLHLRFCNQITEGISGHILAMPHLEELSVQDVRVCTAQWAAALQQQYSATHGRHIVVRR